ncbi:hypothetical protein NA78x_006268 [Anatilimnocola sp. NA78]|uniref:hypothetical protein n=1 Tax=Anatilimnocola sp. NA78 TaxID=3415683 RepID=UPI003CE5A5B7
MERRELLIAASGLLMAGSLRAEEPKAVEAPAAFELQTYRGQAVFLAEALKRLHNVQSVDEAKERTLAIETKDGTLIPIVEDVRGRALRSDERLRKMNLEVLVRKFRGSPAGQVIRLYELTDEGKFEIDYWCDICSIAMYELKICECCQGDIRLRKTKVQARD